MREKDSDSTMAQSSVDLLVLRVWPHKPLTTALVSTKHTPAAVFLPNGALSIDLDSNGTEDSLI
jgi:hypothetical protein